jgi:hypothetical protein
VGKAEGWVMAKVLTSDEFRKEAVPGTIFCYGPKWSFGGVLILQAFTNYDIPDCWGFWASDPCWPEGDGTGEMELLDRCLATGEEFEISTSSSKYMSYDSDINDAVFMVFSPADAMTLVAELWPAPAKEFDNRIAPL